MALETAAAKTEHHGGFTIAGVARRDTEVDEATLWRAYEDHVDDLEAEALDEDRYGVLFDHDEDSGEFTYVAGRRVDSADNLPAELTVVELPEAEYAVFTPTAESVDEVVEAIEHEGLDGQDRAPGPLFERYDASVDPAAPGTPLEFYVPVDEDR